MIVNNYLKESGYDFQNYKHNGHTLAYYWVKYMRRAPPREIYCSPMTENLASLWKELFSVSPPKEMTDMVAWRQYMYSGENDW